MSNFIEMNRAALVQRVTNAMIKNRVSHHFAVNDVPENIIQKELSERAEKIVSAAYGAFLERINAPLEWVGTIGNSMENREFSALVKAHQAAFVAYANFYPTQRETMPEWLSQAMGFSPAIDNTVADGDKAMLQECGQTLFGNSWKKELALHLKNLEGGSLDPRRITHWLDGTRPIPDGVWTQIKTLLRSRADKQIDLAKKISR